MSKVQTDGQVTTEEEQLLRNGDKLRIIKNILITSFCFMISIFANSIFINRYFSTYYGYYSDIIFLAISIFVIVWMFANYYKIRTSKIKLSIWISMLGFAIYFVIKGFGSDYFMVDEVAYFIFRICSAQLWISISSYLLELAKRHKYFGGESLEVRAIRFLGVLNFFQQIAFVLANSWNIYYYHIEVEMNASVCIILAVVSALLVIIFLDGITNDEVSSFTDEQATNIPRNKSILIANVLKLFQQIKIPLIPITLWVGLRSILFSFLLVFSWGYIMKTEIICYGLVCASASLAVGIFIKYCTRRKMFWTAAVIDIVVIISLIVLNPEIIEYNEIKSRKTFLAVIMMLEGTAGAIWDTLLPAFYGVVFNGKSALSTYSKYFGVKYTGIFVVSVIKYHWMNLHNIAETDFWKVLIAIFIVLVLAGMLGYFRIEFNEQKKKKMSTESTFKYRQIIR